MRKAILILLIISVLVILFGTWILSFCAKIWYKLGDFSVWAAKILDFLGWNGLLSIGGV